MLTGLVKTAAIQTTPSGQAIFTVERHLDKIDEKHYQLVSTLQGQQTTVDADSLIKSFTLAPSEELPRLFQIDTQLSSREPFARCRQQLSSQVPKKFIISSQKRRWYGQQACLEHNLILYDTSGKLEKTISPPGGGELSSEEPWVFVSQDGQDTLVASGSVRVPEEEALITLPNGWQLTCTEGSAASEEGFLEIDENRIPLYRIQGDITVNNESTELKYRIRTRQSTESPDTYVWQRL